MATKTINLKMILNRSESAEAKELRQALWTTHEAVNKAVAEIERVLLLCRGRSYWVREKDKEGKDVEREVKAEAVRKEALELARNVQHKNGKSSMGSDDEIISALQQLYEALVPSVLLDKKGEPLKGDSQSVGNSFARPLMRPDPKVGPFPDVAQKALNAMPLWIHIISRDNCEPQKNRNHAKFKIKNTEIEYCFEIDPVQAKDWIAGEGAAYINRMDHVSGAKNAWLKKIKEEKHDEWPMLLAENYFEMQHDVRILIRNRLWGELKLLPLFSPYFEDFKWNGLAVRLAVAHLLTWESWNHRCRKEYEKLSEKVREKEDAVAQIDSGIRQKIEAYQHQRQEELKKNSLATDEREFKINPRMLRALDRVIETWKKCSTQPMREEALAKLQTDLQGKFGDPDFYLWLAEEVNKDLWQHEENPLYEVAQLNAFKRLLAKRKRQSLYTVPDAIKHPKWAQFEAPGGTNLKNYQIEVNKGDLSLTLPLICRTPEGRSEKEFKIPLAPSGQILQPEIKSGEEGKLTFIYADERYIAGLGGSDILFDRSFLEHRTLDKIHEGNIGSVWFKLVLDIEPKAPEGWINAQGKLSPLAAINHFKSGLLNKKHKEVIEPGLRVLSVDLGVRTFASCSVFELVKGKPAKGLCWLADKDKDLWAKHERSFTLTMPGDDISTQAQAARRKAYDELAALRQGKNFIRSLLALSVIEDVEKRTKQFTMLGSGKEKFTGRETAFKLSNEDIAALTPFLQKPLPVWQAQVKMIFDRYEKIVSDAVSEWRNRTRPKDRDREYEMGKSYWGIEYLEKVRDFLKGWSTHAREYGKINRWDRETLGTFASDLLEHINNKKEDRIKTGTDLIIQAARGKVYNKKTHKWEDKFEPCRLILFEDLKMYRFKTDRPKWENSQLMRWSHREIQKEAGQQAAIYGIHIDTTGAGFSSKFYAKNGCPGVRAKKLTRADLDYINSNKSVRTRLAEEGFHNSLLKEGTVVPWPGGEFFASLNDKGNLEIIHADINAAQNLQRRIWTRYADTWRVPVKQINSDGSQWIAQYDSKRIRGGLSLFVENQGFAKFIQTPDGSGFIPEALAESLWKKLSGQTVAKSEEEKESGFDQVEEYLEAAGATTDDDEGKGKEVFFRDASGMILNKDRFYPSKEFWGRVHQTINKALKDRMENHEPNPF